jgi:hypothetical protein
LLRGASGRKPNSAWVSMKREPAAQACGALAPSWSLRARTPCTAPAIGLIASLPLARVALAVEAGDHVHGPAYDPKEQRLRKTPASSAAGVSVGYGKMLGRRGDPFDDVVDFRNEAIGQLRIASAVPVARFDQFSPRSRTEDDRRHAQRRCRRSALSWSHGMLCSRS